MSLLDVESSANENVVHNALPFISGESIAGDQIERIGYGIRFCDDPENDSTDGDGFSDHIPEFTKRYGHYAFHRIHPL
ncbi:hypothetical protein LFE_1533 [Leptospirillum ferrooxidans C2-3]|uniref:Uncharacterized protein n=1 Tax=Leptospirillum ferrooxidans (strain C2-3) TaxID=1162668 RepID=I0IPL6_LEPFC|nr:hypothetical protein LFE_1533 [Leptospirillum ferrooxidans C2-3]